MFRFVEPLRGVFPYFALRMVHLLKRNRLGKFWSTKATKNYQHPPTHAVFVLYAVEGYTHREIEKLKISEGTSKWHLSEARKKLQQQLSTLNP